MTVDNVDMAAQVVIAPPARFRLYLSVYCLALALFLVVFVAEGLMHGARVALIAIGPLAGLFLLVVRAGRLAAFTDEGSLTVRNWFATHRYDRKSIRAFRLGGSFMASGRNAIQVLTAEGSSLPISATIRPWYLISADQQAKWLAGLEEWRRGGPSTATQG
jgi:hypothetical protein